MNDSNTAEAETAIAAILQLADNSMPNDSPEFLAHVRTLRNLCARGAHNQLAVSNNNKLQLLLHKKLFDTADEEQATEQQQTETVILQLLANTVVNNPQTLKQIWEHHGEAILERCTRLPLNRNIDIYLMIVYNVMKNGTLSISQAIKTVVGVWQLIIGEKSTLTFEFLHFIFEELLVKDGRQTVRYYSMLQQEDRIAFLDYLSNYLHQNSPNGLVHLFLLQYIAKEFKIKSDCILRHTTKTNTSEAVSSHPREAYNLLRIIASASGSENYANLYERDHSLFLNVSSMLRCLVEASKVDTKSDSNLFAPMNKLEQVALNSNISREFENEISYELKTLLVRCVANLLYKNPTNQGYCLDTELMPALLECTNMDARNPLMKEWSILAIRNACIGCPEIQEVISGLTKRGDAPNTMLDELNMDMGSLRIRPNEQ